MSADLTLSDRQESILVYIIRYLRENKIPPSIRNIGEAVGISSTSVVNYNLTKLQDMGLIDRTPEVSRGLSVNFEQVERVLSGLLANNGSPTGLIRVPVFGHIQAGLPVDVPDVRNWQTAEEWVQLTAEMFGDPSRLFALKVQGDSMKDAAVQDGDIIILRHQESANNGDMVAAWLEGDDETTLKFLNKKGDTVELLPANSDYQPIVRPADQVRISGKVVSVIRYMN